VSKHTYTYILYYCIIFIDILFDKHTHTLTRFENLNGLGSFSNEKIITRDADLPTSVFAIDLNGDGYKDVLSSSKFDGMIAW